MRQNVYIKGKWQYDTTTVIIKGVNLQYFWYYLLNLSFQAVYLLSKPSDLAVSSHKFQSHVGTLTLQLMCLSLIALCLQCETAVLLKQICALLFLKIEYRWMALLLSTFWCIYTCMYTYTHTHKHIKLHIMPILCLRKRVCLYSFACIIDEGKLEWYVWKLYTFSIGQRRLFIYQVKHVKLIL